MWRDPVKHRAALEQHLAKAWAAYNDETQARQAAEHAVPRARRELADEQRRRAAGMAKDKDVVAAQAKLEKAKQQYDRHAEATNSALDAAKAIELDLEQLMRSFPGLFAERAEAATQAAARAMETAADALRDAQTAWTEAQAAWAPLAKAQGVSGVEDFPLPDPDQVVADVKRGAIVARPQAVSVAG